MITANAAAAASSDSNGRVTLDPAPAGDVDVVCMPASNRWSAPSSRVVVAAGARSNVRLWSVEAPQDAPATTGIGLDPFAVTPRVIAVTPNSTAARAGVQVGDVIVAVNCTAVDGLDGSGVDALVAGSTDGVALTLARGALRPTVRLVFGSK